jgi:hypothetical protein
MIGCRASATARIGLHVAEITSVARHRGRQSVRDVGGVVMIPGARRIGGRAITELVNVESVLLIGGKPREVGHDFDLTVGGLAEVDSSASLIARRRLHDGDGLFDAISRIACIGDRGRHALRHFGTAGREQPCRHNQAAGIDKLTPHKSPPNFRLLREP